MQKGFTFPALLLWLLLAAVIGGILLIITNAVNPTLLSKAIKPTPKRIAIITASDLQLTAIDGVKAGLSELGYKEGINVIFDLKNPKGDRELTKKMAADIVASKPDLIVSASTTATKAVQEAVKGTNIPIVFVDVGTVAELGISNLQHPSGNITGVGTDSTRIAGKRMEILKEVVPTAKTFGVLINPNHVS